MGINVQITNLQWAQWLEEVFKNRDYDLTIVSHTEPYDIGIYARDDYYFQYSSDEFKTLNGLLNDATNPADRRALVRAEQRLIADDFVNGYLFQLAKTGVANAKIVGLWANSPTQANDMTGVYWKD